MTRHTPSLALRLADTDAEVAAAQALRYRVFVEELGGQGGDLTDRAGKREADCLDRYCEHFLLLDSLQDNAVVGTTRVMTEDGAAQAGRYASESEFDLSGMTRSGRRLLEVSRTCLDRNHRGGAAMHRLWQGLAALVEERGIEVLFGLASFPGTDPSTLEQPLACLHHDHLAPEALRPRSLQPVPVDIVKPDRFDRRAAMLATPALVKAYLRLGGKVGEGAFLDRAFGCIDVCMVLDTAVLSERARAIYAEERR